MESYNNNQEESINSSEERVDDQPSDQEKNDAGVGRSYECVFCKRGFNTAQALGGHMNIHRKDRARNKPTSRDHKNEENHYLGPRFYQQMIIPDQSENNYINDHHHYNLSYATYFPESSTSTRSHFQQKQPENPLIMNEDWRLSLDFTPKIIEDLAKISEEEELDLELRLGYDS